MIGYLRGKIILVDKDYIILESNGVGFVVFYNLKDKDIKVDTNKSVFIAHRFTDFGEYLFGFDSYEEKLIFDFLINLKIIGPRNVFQIMSELNIHNFNQLNTIDIHNLLKINGVGNSTATKFLFALNNKLKKIKNTLDVVSTDNILNKYKDIINVVTSLGFSEKEVLSFLKNNIDYIENLSDTESIIKYIIKNIKV